MDTSHTISALVDAFLEAAQAVVASSDQEVSDARPAELTYELDQIVSNYLDVHQISTEHYDAIHQDVVNIIAHHLGEDSSGHPPTISLDEQGNAGLSDVIMLIDHHYSDGVDLMRDTLDAMATSAVEAPHHGGLG
jgi:hypothetical protein